VEGISGGARRGFFLFLLARRYKATPPNLNFPCEIAL